MSVYICHRCVKMVDIDFDDVSEEAIKNTLCMNCQDSDDTPQPSHTEMRGKHPENIIIDMDGLICGICDNPITDALFCIDCEKQKPHIVKCVNAHDALVGALKSGFEYFRDYDPDSETDIEDREATENILKSALKLAGETT